MNVTDGPGTGDATARANEFWFQFDNFFNPRLGQSPAAVRRAYAQMHGPDFVLTSWREHRAANNYPEKFRQDVEAVRQPVLFLAENQLRILDQFFGGDAEAERRAFVDFGQGILFDDRRPPTEKLHKMDIGDGDSPPVGYHRWHAFIQAVTALGGDAARWLQVDREVALAWAVQSEARPKEDAPDNPGLPSERLGELTTYWMGLSIAELDTAFDHDPFPAGIGTAGLGPRARSGFDMT